MAEETAIDATEIRERILAFIRDELLFEELTVGPEDDLLSGELLDSLAVLRLATYVDETFAIGMQPTDFTVENFRTAELLTAYVLGAAGSARPAAG